MWFGTGNGLIRYDGTNVYRYEHNPSDSKSLPNTRINAIVEDKSRNIWIGTAQGLAIYDREKDNFRNVDSITKNTNHLTNGYISALAIDGQGRVWIGTHGNGLNIYNPKTFTFSYRRQPLISNKIPPADFIVSILNRNDTIWVGTKGGLKIFDASPIQELALPFADPSLASKEITQVVNDSLRGKIWIGTVDREVIKLSTTNGKFELVKTALKKNMDGEEGGSVLTICVNKDGNLWLGGENSGLNFMDTKSFHIQYFEPEEGSSQNLPTNSIRSIYVDDTGITWIGTYRNGPYLIDNHAKKFTVFKRNPLTRKGLRGNSVKGIVEDRVGNIWIISDGGGLGKLEVGGNELKFDETINNKIGTKYLSTLCLDSKDNLWIGTFGKGIFRLNMETSELKNYNIESKGFGDNKVSKIFQDSNQKIWVGSVGSGLFYFNPSLDKFLPFQKENKGDNISKSTYISSILEDSEQSLWIGTLFGLYKLRQCGVDEYQSTLYLKNGQPGRIGSYEIESIFEDAEKNLWFGTGDNGLALLPKKSFSFKNIRDGLPSKTIRGILADSNGNLWLSSDKGLSKYNPATGYHRTYLKEDGLPSNEFNANAYILASNGKMYFGTDNGMVTFFPDSIRNNTIKPVVYFTDLKMNNQSVGIDNENSPLEKHISLTRKIELAYNQRAFVVDFVAVNYGQSSRNSYCYKLEGFDDDWNCVGVNSSATYTNLDAGHYVLTVKAYNSDGISSEVPARLEITIPSSPWKSWWAILVYILFLSLLIIFLVKVRVERIKIKNQLEMEKLAREKQHALGESKTQFFTNISHELRTPLSLISMPLENLLSTNDLPETVKDRLFTMRANTDKMTRLVNELMDFNKLESGKLKLNVYEGELIQFILDIAAVFKDVAEKRNIHFGVHPMVGSLKGWFDHDKLEKILVNVISNAFKFTSDNGKINLIVNASESLLEKDGRKTRFLEVTIVDNGLGISSEELPFIFDKFYQAKSSAKISNPGTGIGLSLTKGLVELHYGSIKAESIPNHETRFILLLPIDQHVYKEEEIGEAPEYSIFPPVVQGQKEHLSHNNHDVETDLDKQQVLIVEDNDELRKYISLELRGQFNVLEAKDGNEGLEIASERTPDLIISDISMPFKSGIELCNELKSNIKTSHIPFILLTAKTTTDDQITGLTAGADIYITKPFSIRFLMAQVNQIITSREKLYSRFSQDVYLLPGKVARNEIDKEFLQKAIDYIVDNLQNSQLGVDSMADLFNLSRMQVYRKIKALTGKSVVDFIRMVRVKQALKLMESDKFTISEIAFKTGFSSASYFTRCFKDEYGKAPSEYMEAKN